MGEDNIFQLLVDCVGAVLLPCPRELLIETVRRLSVAKIAVPPDKTFRQMPAVAPASAANRPREVRPEHLGRLQSI